MRKAILEAVIVTVVSFLLAGVIFAAQYNLPHHGLNPEQVQTILMKLSR